MTSTDHLQQMVADAARRAGSIAALARQLGVSRTTIYHWLDDPAPMTLRDVAAVAAIAGWTVTVKEDKR